MSAHGRRTLKEDDEMWGSDEDCELKDTEDFDGDAQAEVGEVGCEGIWCS